MPRLFRQFSVRLGTAVLVAVVLAILPSTIVFGQQAPRRQPPRGRNRPPIVVPVQTPLIDMGAVSYMGFFGGLYPEITNTLPLDHLNTGLARAGLVQPLNGSGQASGNGKVVLLSIGMSNTSQEFCGAGFQSCNVWTFMGQAAADPLVNHSTLTIVNGAQNGMAAPEWDSPSDGAYNVVASRLNAAGATPQQVQIIWLKVADRIDRADAPSLPDAEADAFTLEGAMGRIVRALKVKYPNLRQVFISSRIFAGYATSDLNPEPYAFESGFSVKWLIEAQIDQMRNVGIDPLAGDLNYNTVAPWIAWGPYLWANGDAPRSDGLVWLPTDFEPDGTHPSQAGEQKVGAMLLAFFKTSPATACWFLAGRTCGGGGGGR